MIKRNFEYINKEAFEVLLRYVSETTIRICCASMITISDWFEGKITAVTKKSNRIS